MGVTSQVTDRDYFVYEIGKGVASVGNVRVHDIDQGSVEPFVEHFGRVRETLKHQGIPYVPTGLMGDIPCVEWGNLYPSVEFTFESNKF
jgi:hypothetical protein